MVRWTIKRVWAVLLLAMLAMLACAAFAEQSANEVEVWRLEHAYWEYVKAVDLVSYRALWHENFVGWPDSSSQPVRKDHITDWITASTSKGEHLKWYLLKPAASQATENMVVTHYWLTGVWADKDGQGKPETSRITHTWIKVPSGWQIVGGMSSSEAEAMK
jgi:hypothetical protein